AGELLEVGGRQRIDLASSGAGESEPNDPLVVGVVDALEQPRGLGAVDELHGAVMAKEQVLGHLADRRWRAMSTNGEEELVLRAGETDRSRLVVAPPEEPAQPVAEAEEASEVGVIQRR